MEIITNTNKPAGTSLIDEQVTAEEINLAFAATLSALKCVASATRDFAKECIHTGTLLRDKRAEFPPRGGWVDWLENHCPEISRMTAHRLITISETVTVKNDVVAYVSGGRRMELPDRLSSVREFHESLFPALLADESRQPSTGEQKQSTSKLVSVMARFWGAITRRPPESWDELERHEFLIDLAERDKIRRKQGWKTIDV
jgi:hypothetical protein